VISVSAAVRFVNRITDLETPPDYSHPVAAPDLNIIVHHDSFPIAHGVNPGVYVQASGKVDAVNNSNEFFVYYGNVVYRDTLYPESSSEGLHQTTWCFVYQPLDERRKFIRGGPEEYNLYT
jgi:cAMP phosphodiesterase